MSLSSIVYLRHGRSVLDYFAESKQIITPVPVCLLVNLEALFEASKGPSSQAFLQ